MAEQRNRPRTNPPAKAAAEVEVVKAPDLPDPEGWQSKREPPPEPEVADPDVPLLSPLMPKATFEIPVAEVFGTGYISRHIDTHLTRRQSLAYRALFNALHAGPLKKGDGKYVNTPVDALRWLFDRLADEILGEETAERPE